MSKITTAVNEVVGSDFKIGVQVMSNANQSALAIAKLCGGSFIRVGALVGQTTSPHGLVVGDAVGLMEYRNKLDAFDIAVAADVYTRHYQWTTSNKPLEQIATYAHTAGADAVCLEARQEETVIELIQRVSTSNPKLPIILSGYTNHNNAKRLLTHADGAFVGSCFEKNGWGSAIDKEKVAQYMELIHS